MSDNVPDNLITYGPNTNCTLALCEVSWSVLGYRPSLAASGTFIALFAITMIFHIVQGFNWRTWWFVACMILGCIDEILGYSGRVMLYYNPFSFSGFLIEQSMDILLSPILFGRGNQLADRELLIVSVCITTAAVFFCAALYVTLART
jgi:cell division protein FtsW (lipid II flippase)